MPSPNSQTAFSILAVCAIVITAWGIVWARWSPSHSMSHYINLHAALISAAGIGFICVLGICHSLMKRIEALESAVNQTKRGK